MKKFLTLLLAAGMMFSAVNSASAVEYKVSGMMDFTFETFGNAHAGGEFMTDRDYHYNATPWNAQYGNSWGVAWAEKHFNRSYQKRHTAVQRFRIGVEIIASESLSAFYEAQVGTFTWGGQNGNGETMGGNLGGRSANVTTNKAYLDWMIPCTDVKVRMGLQPIALPSYTFNTPILDDRGTGIVVTIPVTENITITPLWIRAMSDSARANSGNLNVDRKDLMDVFGLVSDFQFNGWATSVYAVYSKNGRDARGGDFFPAWSDSGRSFVGANYDWMTSRRERGDSKMWGAGVGFELTMFDPFRFTADFFYGSADNETSYQSWNSPWLTKYDTPWAPIGTRVYSSKADDRSGWYAALGFEYKASWGTPGLKAWYASGDNSDWTDGSERMPTISGSFNATSLYHDGAFSLATSKAENVTGSWGVQAKLADVSFIDKLSHDFSVTYVRGTNHVNNVYHYGVGGPLGYLTKEDSFIEIDFNTTYQIYQNLATVLELSYIIEDFDKGVWGRAYDRNMYSWAGYTFYDKAKFSDMWRAAINFRYTF